jgi:FkbM family methyltransferase
VTTLARANLRAHIRTKLLDAAGGSWLAAAWANRKCNAFGVRARRVAGRLELRKQNRAILLAAKHAFFAPEVALSFDAYAHALPAKEANGIATVDFATVPDTFNFCRRTLRQGVGVEAKDGGIWLRKGGRAMILAERHLVYAADIATDFERYFLPLVPEMRDGVEVLDYSQPGKLQTYRTSGLEFEMASFPEEEEELEQAFRWYRPKAGDLVFDMGAHCGVSTYHLSKLVGPEGKVVAFEPDPLNFEILKKNIERYRLANVILQNTAIAGTAGKLAFSSEGTVGSKLMSVLPRESAGAVVMVEAMTLADAFARWGVPDFCKIDIEGAEIDVIAKSAEVLRSHKTNFSLDTCHLKPDGQSTHSDVEALFRSYGYEVASEANPMMETWARPEMK